VHIIIVKVTTHFVYADEKSASRPRRQEALTRSRTSTGLLARQLCRDRAYASLVHRYLQQRPQCKRCTRTPAGVTTTPNVLIMNVLDQISTHACTLRNGRTTSATAMPTRKTLRYYGLSLRSM
jgi:hypothetical protein